MTGLPNRRIVMRCLALVGLILALVIPGTRLDLAELQRSIPADSSSLLLVALVAGAAALAFRAMGWRPFVGRLAAGQKITGSGFFMPAAASFLNGVLPARAGEAARIALITRRLDVGAARVAGTVVSDAFGSLLAWAFLAGGLVVATAPGGVTPVIVGAAWLAVAVGAMAAAATPPGRRGARRSGNRVRRLLPAVVVALGEGMRGLRELRASAPADAASSGAWVSKLVVVAVALGALVPTGTAPPMVASSSIVSTAAQAAPMLPGGIGTTHPVVMTPLITVYGIGVTQALAVSVVLPLAPWLLVALIGWIPGAHAALREPLARPNTQET